MLLIWSGPKFCCVGMGLTAVETTIPTRTKDQEA